MFKAGDVVVLRSGGDAMTIESTKGKEARVVWMGEEGDLFRDTLPFAVLMAAEFDEDDSDDDAEDDHDDAENDEDDENAEQEEDDKDEAEKAV
ncbi:MAG: DUF2158 domain-containing protein [Labrys sp. (in: a-proteobacteria)]